MMRRRGGPRLVRAAATTAVVAGTAGAVSHHQQQKYASQAEQQQASMAPQMSQDEPDYTAEIERLAQLKAQGIITEDEFQAKKKAILGI